MAGSVTPRLLPPLGLPAAGRALLTGLARAPGSIPQGASDLVPYGAAAASVAGHAARLARSSGQPAATFINPERRGVASITLTGWGALASLVTVCAVVGTVLVLAVKRYRGSNRNYTLVVKQAAAPSQ